MQYTIRNNATNETITVNSLTALRRTAVKWEDKHISNIYRLADWETVDAECKTVRHRISLLIAYLADHAADWMNDPNDPQYLDIINGYLVTRITAITK
ncbi:hypothetical protein [Bifidobacterium sp. SO1]|uniref:hypothetical protein n=1 Tax=Bifidobacterium sp. SO1 TaxID=2809029 RepID=UPI001BDC053B|nr:hypothetical protein [Bifidobacterium sp. SO1]MBT1162187.1 hypothetical protein [Bifidobacterium sp. SO1]